MYTIEDQGVSRDSRPVVYRVYADHARGWSAVYEEYKDWRVNGPRDGGICVGEYPTRAAAEASLEDDA